MLVYALRDAHQLADDREPGRLHAAHLAGARRPAPRARQGGRPAAAAHLRSRRAGHQRPADLGGLRGLGGAGAGLDGGAVLMVTVGLGLCTVTLWTPYPARRPGERRDAKPWDEAAMVIPDAA